MFLANKYAKHYFALIEKRKSEHPIGYVEEHHIIPVCMGGSDESSNKVKLAAREHFLAHHLLMKAVDSEFRSRMAHAFWLMSHMKSGNQNREYRITSSTYSIVRALHAKGIGDRLRGRKMSLEMCEAFRGPKSKEHREAISQGKKGLLFTSDHKRNISQACKGRRWMSKDGKYRMVSSQDVADQLISEGWVFGRTGWSGR